jgi:hypothetical protein
MEGFSRFGADSVEAAQPGSIVEFIDAVRKV